MNSTEQNAGADQIDPLITITYNDLMTLAKRLIGEQLDDCAEEFLAGRAHSIGSLHSEILALAKASIARQVQDAPKTAGESETCRSSEKVQVSLNAVRTAIKDAVRLLWDTAVNEFAEPAEDGDDAGKRNYDAGKAAGAHALEQELVRWLDGLVASALAPQSTQSEASAPSRGSYSREVVESICDAYESGMGHGLKCDGHHSGAAFADPNAAAAYELGYEEGKERSARDQNPLSSELAVGLFDTAANSLSAMLWLYRRLPRGYGRLSVVEGPILALAKQTGIDVAECLAERGSDPQVPNENN